MEGPNAQLKTCHECANPNGCRCIYSDRWALPSQVSTPRYGLRPPQHITRYTHTHTTPFLLPLPASRFSNLFSRSPWACAFVLRGSSGMSRGTRIIRQAFLHAQIIYCRVVVYGGHPRSRRPASPNLAPFRQLWHHRVGREGVVRQVSIYGAGRVPASLAVQLWSEYRGTRAPPIASVPIS
jgi:hypothetical protein